jgi:hypothetical protein
MPFAAEKPISLFDISENSIPVVIPVSGHSDQDAAP